MIDADAAQPITGAVFASAPFIAGAGPEQATLAALRARTGVTLMTDAVAQALRGRGFNRADVDVRSPQQFVQHPRVQLLEQTTLGADLAWPRAPGRAPGAGWDGEPGYHAPNSEDGDD